MQPALIATHCSSVPPTPTHPSMPIRLRDHPDAVRAVLALGLFSIAEHAVWVTILVVAYQHGGVVEAGVVSFALLIPAAIAAPMVARELVAANLPNPLIIGYALQTAALGLATAVTALDLDSILFYMSCVLVSMTTVFSRPAHHAFIARIGGTIPATVATGVASASAHVLGPLVASVVLAQFEVVHVFAVSSVFLCAATAATAGLRIGPPTNPTADRDGQVGLRLSVRSHRRLVIAVFALLASVTVVLGAIETLATEVSFALTSTDGPGSALLIAAVGAGLLVGAPVAGRLSASASETQTIRVGAVISGAAMVAGGAPIGLAWSIGAFVAVGVGMQMVLVAGWLLLHRSVCRTRTCTTFGWVESQQLVGNGIGAVGAGFALGSFGVWPVVIAAGCLLPLATLMLTRSQVDRVATAPQGVTG
jgi:hypothetical protein